MRGHTGTPDYSADRFHGTQETPRQEPIREDNYLQTSAMSGVKVKRGCNCQKSRCIKLYCECYANGVHCNECNCVDCLNNGRNEDSRKNAIKTTLEKNPAAFQPKITSSQLELKNSDGITARHNKGCACRKSHCLKKYCECFQAGIPCTSICKCVECHNLMEHNHSNPKGDETIAIGGSRYQLTSQAKQRPSQMLYMADKLEEEERISNMLNSEIAKAKIMRSDLENLLSTHRHQLPQFSESIEGATPRKSQNLERSGQKSSSGAKVQHRTELGENMLKKRSPVKLVDKLACDEELSEESGTKSQVEEENYTVKGSEWKASGEKGELARIESATERTEGIGAEPAEVSEFQLRKFLILKGFLGHLKKITESVGSQHGQAEHAKVS